MFKYEKFDNKMQKEIKKKKIKVFFKFFLNVSQKIRTLSNFEK